MSDLNEDIIDIKTLIKKAAIYKLFSESTIAIFNKKLLDAVVYGHNLVTLEILSDKKFSLYQIETYVNYFRDKGYVIAKVDTHSLSTKLYSGEIFNNYVLKITLKIEEDAE